MDQKKLLRSLMLVLTMTFDLMILPRAWAENHLAGAKREGELLFYSVFNIPDGQTLLNEFQKRYPFIKAKHTRLPRTRLIERLLTEGAAGRYLWDVTVYYLSFVPAMREAGLLATYDSPEGRMIETGLKDEKGYWTGVAIAPQVLAYNTKKVKREETPKSYDDLLHPRWKGRIATGTESYDWFQTALKLRGRERGLEFMRRLKEQGLRFGRGRVGMLNLMAAGEYDLITDVHLNSVIRLAREGAPVGWVAIEPVPTIVYVAMVAAKAPHPNATRLFVDFLLSQEGQTLLKKVGRVPLRQDVEPDLLEIRQRKLYIIREEGRNPETIKLFNEVFELSGQ